MVGGPGDGGNDALGVDGSPVRDGRHAGDRFLVYRGHGRRRYMNPHSGLEVNTDLFAVDRNIVDGLQIGHSVEEDVSLRIGSPVGNRAEVL